MAAVGLGCAAVGSVAVLALADGQTVRKGAGTPPGFPPPPISGPATVWAVGDGADGSSRSRSLAEAIEERDPERFLYLGDVYDNGTAVEYATNYAPVYGRFNEIAAPTPGNHEWDNRNEGYHPYWLAAKGAPMPLWYSFHAGGWQILSLNSEAPHGSTSEQLQWLRGRLQETPQYGNCRLAFWHKPRYSAGAHGDEPDIDPLWDALARRARLVLNGHDHSMQRFKGRRGIVEFVSGAGGHEMTGVDDGDHRLAFKAEGKVGALRVALRRRRANFAFVGGGGRVLDSGSKRCHRG